MTIRLPIAFAGVVLLTTSACMTPRAHLIPGSDMVRPKGGIRQLLDLPGKCLQTRQSGAGPEEVGMYDCTPVRPDSLRVPALAVSQAVRP